MTALLKVSVVAMSQTTVKGVLMNQGLNEPEPFATVRMFKQGKTDKPVAMFLTDENGQFSQQVKGKGSFDFVFSSVGKEDLHQTVTLRNTGELNLGTLYIKESETTLQGVVVVAQKPLVKMDVDKMSYNVSQDEDAKSATVLDMLRKVPMVTVDGQDNITVNGSSSFKVYVDGKPSVMFSQNPSMVFKSMPATAVKNIEVVTNPGARYDAEGVGGVLNIVMNKQNPQAAQSLNGYNGTVRASVGNKSLGGSAFISGQQGKLSYSLNVMENYSTPGTTSNDIEQANASGSLLTSASTKTKVPFTMGSLNLGYDIDSVRSVNFTGSMTRLNLKSDGPVATQMNYATPFAYGYDTHLKNTRTSFNGSVDYQRVFNSDRTRSLTLTYQLGYNPSKNELRNDFDKASTDGFRMDDRYSDSKESTTEHTFQADYATPLGKGQTLDFGAKLMTRRASSDSKYYLDNVFSSDLSMDYLYKNTIVAGYAEYSVKGQKMGAKGGLRYEHTWQDVEYRLGNGENFSKNYGSLVPSASLSYTLSQGSNIGLTYNMRISRPGISYLNPYVNRADPTTLSYGNTDLDVEKSHNTALVYNLFSPKFMMNLNLHHNFTNNGIEQYSFYDGDLLNTTYGNIVKRHQTGLNGYVNWLVTPKTRLFLNGGVDYTDLRSDALDAKNGGWHANVMAGLQQTLPGDFKLGAFLISSTKNYTLQGWSSGFNMVTANISKSLLKDKLSISVMGMTGLSKGGNLNIENYSRSRDFSNHSCVKVPLYGFTATIAYTFGNSKAQARQHTTKVENDYIEQQSQGEIINSIGSQQQ